ncbi:MAG TPA: hypothetical protein VHT28_02145 [Silvibacterium sp.]|jgi:hypothetical protein|nr:hypothetical protein [Silvibacterium sp.]
MSAALILPYVWATVSERRLEKSVRLRPLGGLAFYRKRTELLLRRYMRVSMDMGRVPSVMGNIVFRGRASSYRIRNFEDAVIFVIDVEKCLKRLDGFSQELIARIALQEYTQAETAELMGQGLRSVTRKYAEVLDRLTSIFLESRLLIPDHPEICQEGDLL